jgi:ferrous iron transport protein B
MATRTLRDPKERLATLLTAPFMNCGAKLPVYSLLIASFFSAHRGSMMFLVTLMSWFFALIIAGILRKTILRGESTPFVMEIPPYRLPTLKGILIHMWERTFMYIRKAGTLILGASIIMWIIMTFPMKSPEEMAGTDPSTWKKQRLEYSLAGRVGKGLESITRPMMGFDWQTNIALIAGFAAKEVVVSTLGVAYSLGASDDMGEEEEASSLSAKLQADSHWNPLVAFSLIVFVMLYVPCVSVISVMLKETRSLKIVAFSVTYTTIVAALMATIVFQVGTFLFY